jgi:arylsulfatase A-like enzyme
MTDDKRAGAAQRGRVRRGVVMIMCDQLPAHLLGYAGHRQVSTPNIDGLARRSQRFDRAYAANPTCMPNRATVFSGRWPSSHGTRTNGLPLSPQVRLFTHELARHGWATSAAGKLHFQNMGWPWEPEEVGEISSRDPRQLDPEAVAAQMLVADEGWDRFELLDAHRRHRVELPSPYYGFDRVDLVVGHGDRPSGHYHWWAAEQGVDLDALGGYDNAANRLAGWVEVWRSRIPVEAHPTTYTADRTIEQIRSGAAGDRPFFVFCSFPDPHHPFCPPDPYFDHHHPGDISLPATFDPGVDRHVNPTAHVAAMFAQRGRPRYPTAAWAPDETQLRASLAAQYGQVELLDDAIGRVLDTLVELGIEDEVAVVFTSDHGDMMGEHGLLLKHAVHYEACTRVPLLVHVPGAEPSCSRELVSSADIAATVLELADIAAPVGMQGRALLGGGTRRDALVVEEEHLFGIEDLPGPIQIRSLVVDGHRLTHYQNGSGGELYIHDDDPEELVNRYDDPAYRSLRGELYQRLSEELVNLADRSRAPTAAA